MHRILDFACTIAFRGGRKGITEDSESKRWSRRRIQQDSWIYFTSSSGLVWLMGFSIHYRSTESMHPAQAFEIKQHAEKLVGRYSWGGCEPVLLQQQTDGYLTGQSKPIFFPAEVDSGGADLDALPGGTVLALAEVLCVLSREHDVDWEIGHNYEPEPIGCICNGIADQDLIEQLETFGSIGDLLDDMLEGDDDQWQDDELDFVDDQSGDEDRDDEEPRVLKFPGTE